MQGLQDKAHGKNQSSFTIKTGLAYTAPTISIYFLMGPINILQGMYAKYFGLSLTSIAAVILLARLFDAVSDPLIGHFSDRYYAARGSRKPFVLLGGVFFLISSWFLYVPPNNVTTTYFLVWFLAFYLAYTLFVVPHYAWGGELVTDGRQRNTLYSMRALGVFSGTALFFIVPLLPIFDSNEFTPITLKWAVALAGALMIPMLYICAVNVPDTQSENQTAGNRKRTKLNAKTVVRSIFFNNKPFLIFTCAHICTSFGLGMWFAFLFLFADAFLGAGHQFAIFYAISYVCGCFMLKLWHQLAKRMDKQPTWCAGMSLVSLGVIISGLLTPETPWYWLLSSMMLVIGGLSAFNIMLPSILVDIVDYGTLKSSVDQSGTYFSIYTLVNKAMFAISGALGFAVAGWFGFDATNTVHDSGAILGARLVMAWIPLCFVLLSIYFIYKIPITLHRHSIIRRRLKHRMQRNIALLEYVDS